MSSSYSTILLTHSIQTCTWNSSNTVIYFKCTWCSISLSISREEIRMLLRINTFTFSRTVPRKSAIKLSWASQFCPLPSKQGRLRSLYITHPLVSSPLHLPQENHIWGSGLCCLNNKYYTQFRMFLNRVMQISPRARERLTGRNSLTHS